jgi:hypothetical protein
MCSLAISCEQTGGAAKAKVLSKTAVKMERERQVITETSPG